ncbi:MAG: ATP-grasp domain-containing protein [Chitinophagaceae bacterium]|nr:MAG: ATP-grasp domain-containing protein [Chitinophagaceae bacterium]
MNILITSAGQRVSLVRAFQTQLKSVYPGAKVFTTDMQPALSAACNVSDGYFQVKRVTDPAYMQELEEICMANEVGMIVPTIDTELLVLATHKQQFAAKGIHIIVCDHDFTASCRDKRIINKFFEKAGVEVPKEVDRYKPTFPLFIKPFDGSLSADIFLVHNADQLSPAQVENPRFMFMEYIDRNEYDEYTVDMYYDRNNALKCLVPRKRIHVRAGEINKGLTCKNPIVSFLLEKLPVINGAVGCLTLQIFMSRKTGRMVAIEINPRFGGGYPLSYQAGANYPLWLINEYFLNQQISYTDGWEDGLLMLRYDDEVLVHGYQDK